MTRNPKLEEMPNLINESPFENWLYLIKPDNFTILDSLKDEQEYMAYILEIVEESICSFLGTSRIFKNLFQRKFQLSIRKENIQ